ncbi:NAD(P)H-dependent glycerol-3-phosphate dehydrogenase [Desulfohalovibrio reitneri]|uniref:NAD(P)H-dependent glycerol-3-phosphate dehydrogenase n=1 Tax=Desulfohalovibrio reitneri TaxID=1307759 RepID=UPI0004A6D94A|nr:NAD(P)H-dependent glycerol-3-phosphate dehydrogenase [Desulfohalovibrio reitneri]
MRVAVIGAGSWGTTLADLLARNGHEARLWVRERDLLSEIRNKGENTWYMPGVKLNENVRPYQETGKVMEGADAYLLAVPSQFLRQILTDKREHFAKNPVVICASKGIERGSLATMSQVVDEALSSLKPRFAMLSGPSFAFEVIRGLPTAVALGCADKKLAPQLQAAFSNDTFRVYTNPDVRGVELGGAIKNVIAIAAGVSDGLGFGSNARAALITRGLAEMTRLAAAMGGKRETFMGLAGMGDLVLTCTGELSRNRQVGLRLGKGQTLLDILDEMKMVAEGVKTTEAVYELGKRHNVELPITETVHGVLNHDRDPKEAVAALMARELKQE